LNILSNELLAQLYSRESNDPFLTLITLSHPDFSSDIRLVNNSVDIVSRGETFVAFPVNIILPSDDGESTREVSITFDNVSRELMNELRTIITPIDVKLEMILASIPDIVQIELAELKIQSISYDAKKVAAKLVMDNFLNVEMTSERYTPEAFRGLF
jgi:hypothetical protein